MVEASNARLSWLGTQQALQEDWLARDWDRGSSSDGTQVPGGLSGPRTHQPTSQTAEASRPAVLQEPTRWILLPSGGQFIYS